MLSWEQEMRWEDFTDMNNFIYENKTKVYFGRGCVKEFLRCLLKDWDTIMLAYGEDSAKKNGVYDEVWSILLSAGKNVAEFSGIMPNPTYEKVMEGARLVKSSGAQMILGIGGGSVTDCRKAVSLAVCCPGEPWENFWERKGIIDFEPLPVAVIVTAAGSGSECNGTAVITNGEKKRKTGHDYPACNPKFALMDPSYTFSVPREQMVSGAFDSLSRIMEAYFSEPEEENVSDEIAEALMKSIIYNTRLALKNPLDYTARSNLLWASTLSENRLVKLGKRNDFGCHLMARQIGAYTDCNHGQAMAVLLPVYYRHIYKGGAKKFARFAKNVWEISPEGKTDEKLAEAGIEALSGFVREIGLPLSFKELEIEKELGMEDEKLLKEIASSCRYSPGSFRRVGKEEILEMFRECLE